MFVFYGIDNYDALSLGRFSQDSEFSKITGQPIPEEYGEVWRVTLGRLPGSTAEVRAMGIPCCRECGDAGHAYRWARGFVVWCSTCAADLLPLLEV